jgi:hypothetical protein
MECSLGLETTHCVLITDVSYVQVTGQGRLVDLDSLVFCLPLVDGPRILPPDADTARIELSLKVRKLAEHHKWGVLARASHLYRPTHWVPLAEAKEWLHKHLGMDDDTQAAFDGFDWDAMVTKVKAAAVGTTAAIPRQRSHLKRARDE